MQAVHFGVRLAWMDLVFLNTNAHNSFGASDAHKASAPDIKRVVESTPSLPREMCWKSRVVSIANESDQVT